MSDFPLIVLPSDSYNSAFGGDPVPSVVKKLKVQYRLSGVNMKDLYQLFPKGPGKLAAKVSGLPKPQGCI